MDWISSGIRNSFGYELVDCVNLGEHVGWLDGVTGGTVTKGYRADYRTSGTLEVDDLSELPEHCAVRVHHRAELNGDVYEHVIATLFPEQPAKTVGFGRGSGSVKLYGPLKALDGDILSGAARGIAAGTAVGDYFAKKVAGSHRTPFVTDAARLSRTGYYHVWPPSTSVLHELHLLADTCGGYITDDEQGRVVLLPYQLPASMADSFEMGAGEASLVLTGVVAESPEIVNKVVCTYEIQDNGTTHYVTREAQVAVSHPWHHSRIGRWCAVAESPPTIPDGADVGATLQAFANKRLAELTDVRRTFSATALYDPAVDVRRVGRFVYDDGGERIDVRCFVSQMEIRLDAAMRCQLTLEEV